MAAYVPVDPVLLASDVRNHGLSEEELEWQLDVNAWHVQQPAQQPELENTEQAPENEAEAETDWDAVVAKEDEPATAENTEAEAEHECPICGEEQESGKGLNKHINQHISEQEDPLACPVHGCEKRYKRSDTLMIHIRDVHGGQAPHACTEPGCEERFSRPSELSKHQQKKH